MPLSRRRLLATAPALAVGGCLASDEGGPPTPTDCPDEPRVPEADPHPDGAEIPPIPDPPESLADEGAVEAYANDYELAIKWRDATRKFNSPIVSVSLDVVSEVRRAGETAAVVDLTGMAHGRVDFGNESPGHFDGFRYVASYLVTEEGVWRAEEGIHDVTPPDPPDPAEDGTLLECF